MRQYRQPLSYVAAAVLILFGLHFLGVLRIPFLYREARLESTSDPSSVLGAYVMGLAFGFGWTPCVGPALAAILFVASASGDLWRGGTLLLVYGLAMTCRSWWRRCLRGRSCPGSGATGAIWARWKRSWGCC